MVIMKAGLKGYCFWLLAAILLLIDIHKQCSKENIEIDAYE